MLDRVSGAASCATNGAGTFTSDETTTGKSASYDPEWFSKAARDLLAKPGLELHLLTDVDESLCYRYAGNKVKVTEYVVTTLLRSSQGWQWLAALMDGSDAEWWRELKAVRDLTAQFKITRRP